MRSGRNTKAKGLVNIFRSKFCPEVVKSRSHKVAEELRRIFSCIFNQDDFYDFTEMDKPLLTVTGVEVSSCLRYARVFVTEHNNDSDKKLLIEYLGSRAKKYRFDMAKQLKLKFVPEISFHYDTTEDEIAALDAAFLRFKDKVSAESSCTKMQIQESSSTDRY